MHGRMALRAYRLSWLAYATYYLGRRSFPVVKKVLHDKLGLSEAALGRIDTAYLTAYSLGQFLSGFLGDHVGARRLVGYGMLLSAAACVAFGSSSAALVFGVIFAVNGLAQATGWPGTTRAVADFTTPENRGSVMGLFSTCYQVGGFAAVWLAGWLASHYGWRSAFYVPAVAIAGVGLLILALLPSPPPTTASGAAASAMPDEPTLRSERRAAQLAVVKNPTLWFYAASYFCVKIVRYALLFWLPYYLSTAHGYSTELAARVSTAFDGGGLVGVILIGYLSDRSKRFGRAGMASLWLVGLALAFVAYVYLGSANVVTNVLASQLGEQRDDARE